MQPKTANPTSTHVKETIIYNTKAIATELKIDNRIPKFYKQAFVTITDYKENFLNNPQYF